MTVFSKGLQLMWGQTGMSYNIEASGTVHHQFRAFRLEELRFARGSQRPRITNKRRCVQVAVHLAAKVRSINAASCFIQSRRVYKVPQSSSTGVNGKYAGISFWKSVDEVLCGRAGNAKSRCSCGRISTDRGGVKATSTTRSSEVGHASVARNVLRAEKMNGSRKHWILSLTVWRWS